MQSEKRFLLEFIEQYELFPCLWKIKSREYSDRNLKTEAYNVMVDIMRSWDPYATRDCVVKKINNIRTAYRRELKRVKQSEQSGAGEDDIYVPRLWYYDHLHFLMDQETPWTSTSNIEDTQVRWDETSDTPHSPSNSVPSTPTSPGLGTATSYTSSKKRRPTKACAGPRNTCDEVTGVIGRCLAQPSQAPDKFTNIGVVWASKLRDLEPLQAVHAEKLINDIFYEAELGNLDRHCSIQLTNHLPSFTHQSPQNQTIDFHVAVKEEP